MDLTGTSHQKPVIDTHTHKRKESEVTLKTIIKSQERREKEERENKLPKTPPKQLTKW